MSYNVPLQQRGKNSDSLPDDGVLGGLVLGLPLHADELDAGRVERGRDADLNLLRQQRRFEVGFDDHLARGRIERGYTN